MSTRRAWHVRGLLSLLLLVACTAAPAAAWNEALPAPIGFAAMGHDRFAAAYSSNRELRGLVVRFAKERFGTEDTAEIDFGIGYPELTYDPVSDTLLLYRGYEDAGHLVAYAPEGRELSRLRMGATGEALALIPGAGLLAIGDRGDLSLVECRTGVTLRTLSPAGPRGQIDSVAALGGDQLLAHCQGDSGAQYVLLDWRAGTIPWRQPAAPFLWGGRCRVAADSTRIYTLNSRYGSSDITIASRSRRDGNPLASRDLPADFGGIFVLRGDGRLLLLSGSHAGPERLQLLDPASLASTADIAWPAGLGVEYLLSARDLGGGRLLIEGRFRPDSGPLARTDRTCGQLLVDLGTSPPRVRAFDEPLAVDPQGQGWLLGTRRLEVVGEVPWLGPVDLYGTAEILPAGVRQGRSELAFGGGPGQTAVVAMYRGDITDTAAFEALLAGADLCFVGTLAATETHCLGDGGRRREGLVAADFAVDELLWGPDAAVRVHIEGFSVPGCVTYRAPGRPDLERFVPGRRYLVAARWVGDAFVVRDRGLFALDADAPTADQQGGFNVPAPAAAAREFAARIALANQLERADAVVRLGAVENRGVSIAGLVSQVYKGDDALGQVAVWAERGQAGWLTVLAREGGSRPTVDGDPVLFLRSCGPGRYELLEGGWSVVLRGSDGRWARTSGLREPQAAGLLDR